MNKTIKKVLSGIVAASMLSGALSISAGAASMTYADKTLTFNSDKAQNAVLLKAEYSDGVFTGVKILDKEVSLAEGENVVAENLEANVGDKLFLWDGLTNITPLSDVLTVEKTDEGDDKDVIKEWKFDFGAVSSTPDEGYTLVSPDMNFTTNPGKDADDMPFGFLGTGEEDYKQTNRYDGWVTQKGQIIKLSAGGNADADGIGVVGAGGEGDNAGKDIYGNQADVYYPTRFALKVPDDTYYKVKATVTTLDPEKDANVSLYTERKHPIYTKKTIKAGTTDTVEFSVRVTPIYYQKSDPKGNIADEMLTVGVLGENSALAAVEIQQVETIPTVWVLGDSTVTDGNTTLPFFPLQNYTGVGTGLTKYLPRDMAMVNEGEGGLDAYDSLHFDMVKNRIKAGDYMYVEYGHNHKNDGPAGYKSALEKYYNVCHSVGAKLLVVSPVQSVATWNETDKKWNNRFGGDTNFEGAGRSYVEEKIAAGATDIAFANLTKTSVEFVDKVTEDGGNVAQAAQFYYQTGKGGGTDLSHPNDAGAENFAYCFFTAIKEITDETQKAVVQPLIDGMTAELPNLVPADVVAGGIGGSAWPQYIVPNNEKYPVLIKDVAFNDDGTVKQVDVAVRAAEIPFSTYGAIIITIYSEDGTEKGKLYAIDQVDNSTGYGPQTIEKFRGDVKLAEGDTYEAVVVEADADVKPVENGKVYSAVYKPTEIAEHLLLNENKDSNEDFDYYDKKYDGKSSSLSGANGWRQIGSAGITSFLNEAEDGTKYAELTSTGKKQDGNSGSFYYDKALEKEIGTTGRYMISADMQYMSGRGMTVNLVRDHSDKKLNGTESQYLFTVAANGEIKVGNTLAGTISATNFTNVQYILDMDLGTAEITVQGNDPVLVQLDNYRTENIKVSPSKLNQILFGAERDAAFDIRVASLTVAKLKDKALPEYTVTVAANDESKGTVSVAYATPEPEETPVPEGTPETPETPETEETPETPKTEGETVEAKTVTVPLNTVVTAKAVANDGYVFMGWLDENNNKVSDAAEYSFRLRADRLLTADFVKEPGIESVTQFDLVADKTAVNIAQESDAVVNINVDNAKDAENTPIKATNADFTWTCDDSAVTVADGVVTIPSTYQSDSFKKVITVTGTLNNISKTVQIRMYSCNYYEDFSAVEKADDWISNTSVNPINEIVDTKADTASFKGMTAAGNGRVCVIGNGSNGGGKKLTYERDMGVSDKSVLNFGFDIEPHQIRSDGKNAAVTLQFVDSENTKVFDISIHTGGKDSSFNGAAVSGFAAGKAISVDTKLDFTAKKMDYKLTDSTGKVLAEGTADITATNLGKMYFSGDWNYGKFAIDNVYIYYAE